MKKNQNEDSILNLHSQKINRDKLIIYGMLLFLVILIFSIFGRASAFPFTNWDDSTFIENNHLITEPTFHNAYRLMIPGSNPKEGLYIPVIYFSYWLESHIYGLDSRVIHFDNILIHTANALLLFWLILSLFKRKSIAFSVSLLFAIHPLQVETVVWCLGRKDLLSTFFALVMLLIWWRKLENINLYTGILCIILSGLAMASKPTMLILPFIMILFLTYKFRTTVFLKIKNIVSRNKNRSHTDKKLNFLIPLAHFSVIWPILVVFIEAFILFVLNSHKAAVPEHAPDLMFRTFHIPPIISGWLYRIVLISQSQMIYNWLSGAVFLKSFISGVLISIFILYLLFAAFKYHYHWLWFSLIFTMTAFLPTLNVLLNYREFITADRYGYFPLIGIFIIISFAINNLLFKYPRIAILISGILLPALIYHTELRIDEWSSSSCLWEAQIKKVPDQPHGYAGLGSVYELNGRYNEALDAYYKAIQLKTHNPDVFYNTGNILKSFKHYKEAKVAYIRAIEIKPNYVEAYINFGEIFLIEKHPEEALKLYLTALKYKSKWKFQIYMNMATCYMRLNDSESAKKSLKSALKIKNKE